MFVRVKQQRWWSRYHSWTSALVTSIKGSASAMVPEMKWRDSNNIFLNVNNCIRYSVIIVGRMKYFLSYGIACRRIAHRFIYMILKLFFSHGTNFHVCRTYSMR